MPQALLDLRHKVQQQSPMIHCITNPISINQCANTLLAVGARPMMAEHPKEVAEITKTAGALVLNLGNITDVRMDAMSHAAAAAEAKGIPVVLDAVGVASSELRRHFAVHLADKYPILLIKGNYDEIHALRDPTFRGVGVDATASVGIDAMTDMVQKLAQKHDCMVVATGATDIVCDGDMIYHVENGSPRLAEITGTGCMLGVLCGAFLSAETDIDAPLLACALLGIAGEKAAHVPGTGSFLTALLDEINTLSDEDLLAMLRLEEDYEQA